MIWGRSVWKSNKIENVRMKELACNTTGSNGTIDISPNFKPFLKNKPKRQLKLLSQLFDFPLWFESVEFNCQSVTRSRFYVPLPRLFSNYGFAEVANYTLLT